MRTGMPIYLFDNYIVVVLCFISHKGRTLYAINFAYNGIGPPPIVGAFLCGFLYFYFFSQQQRRNNEENKSQGKRIEIQWVRIFALQMCYNKINRMLYAYAGCDCFVSLIRHLKYMTCHSRYITGRRHLMRWSGLHGMENELEGVGISGIFGIVHISHRFFCVNLIIV